MGEEEVTAHVRASVVRVRDLSGLARCRSVIRTNSSVISISNSPSLPLISDF